MMKMVRMKMKMRVELGQLGCFPPFLKNILVTVKIVFLILKNISKHKFLIIFLLMLLFLRYIVLGVKTKKISA